MFQIDESIEVIILLTLGYETPPSRTVSSLGNDGIYGGAFKIVEVHQQ